MSDPVARGALPGDVDPPALPADPGPASSGPGDALRTEGESAASDEAEATDADGNPVKRRRRGSRGGRNRHRGRVEGDGGDGDGGDGDEDEGADDAGADGGDTAAAARAPRPSSRARAAAARDRLPEEMPERPIEGRPRTPEAADRALVRRPQIGDTRPAPAPEGARADEADAADEPPKRRRGGRGRGGTGATTVGADQEAPAAGGTRGGGRRSEGGRAGGDADAGGEPRAGGRGGRGKGSARTGEGRRGDAPAGGKRRGAAAAVLDGTGAVDAEAAERRKGRERNGRPVGRYLMAVHVHPTHTQIAVLEGRSLMEHFVSRPADDVGQIHGNIYLGRVQNVLPGMEAAFVDIGTPKNAVLYRGDVQYEQEDILDRGSNLRIEQMLKVRQTILCQVVKNPIGAKGARLTQEVSIPGRFVVLIPNSSTYGISKRLPDDERKRLRSILDRVKPAEHGVIVRTAAENVTAEEIQRDVLRLLAQWETIDRQVRQAKAPALLYREPDMAVRVIREEFNPSYRGVVIDDRALFEDVRDYVASISPELADRVELYDAEAEGLPLFEKLHVHEQIHKALDRKVWLPSGGSLIIEHTEALSVIDVNTGKNVGTSNLEETVFRNNLEAAEEIARQLRLRDIGGIIVIDFIDMEIRENRQQVIGAFRSALARDKTRTQVFDISELGLVEMTRKRIGEGLLTSFASGCPSCEGRGVIIDHALIGTP